MKNSFMRITALVLAMIVWMSGVACGDSGKTNGDEMTDNSSETEPVTTEDPGPVLEAPEVDYEGYTVTYLPADMRISSGFCRKRKTAIRLMMPLTSATRKLLKG